MLTGCIIVLMSIATTTLAHTETALEPFIYTEDFETGELNAWASYPLWQDTVCAPISP